MRKEIAVFLICIIISFAWWVIHQLNQTYIRQYHINAVITQVPDAYEQDSIVFPVKITVKGTGLKVVLLENYFPENIYIPFKKLKRLSKKKLFSIPPESISENELLPVKIKVLEIQPDTISISFNTKKRK